MPFAERCSLGVPLYAYIYDFHRLESLNNASSHHFNAFNVALFVYAHSFSCIYFVCYIRFRASENDECCSNYSAMVIHTQSHSLCLWCSSNIIPIFASEKRRERKRHEKNERMHTHTYNVTNNMKYSH